MKNWLKKTQAIVLAILMTLVLISNMAFAEMVSGVDADSLGSNKDDYLIEYTEVGIVGISGYVGQQCDILLPDTIHEDEVDLPVEFISYDAFAGNNLIESVVIPDGVIHIFDGAFQGCSMLKTVVIPESVKYIGTDAFSECENLVHVELPSHLSYAGAGIFEGCNKLELTQEQLDTLTYTDDATFQAEQAAFVTDTENLIDVSVYLGVNLDAISSVIDGMPEFIWSECSDGRYCSNDWMALSSLNYEYVESVELFAKSNYAFDGVYVGMTDTDAIKTLLRAGWKLDEKWDIGSSFEKENGDALSFWVDEKRIITNIVLNLSEQDFEIDASEAESLEESSIGPNPVNESYTVHDFGDFSLKLPNKYDNKDFSMWKDEEPRFFFIDGLTDEAVQFLQCSWSKNYTDISEFEADGTFKIDEYDMAFGFYFDRRDKLISPPTLVSSERDDLGGKPAWKIVLSQERKLDPRSTEWLFTEYVMYWTVSDEKFGTYTFCIITDNKDIAQPALDILKSITWKNELQSDSLEESNIRSNPVNEAYAYTTGDVNLRSGPGLGYQSLCVVPNGTRLIWLRKEEVDERGVAWYYISYDGILGWGSSKYVYVED